MGSPRAEGEEGGGNDGYTEGRRRKLQSLLATKFHGVTSAIAIA